MSYVKIPRTLLTKGAVERIVSAFAHKQKITAEDTGQWGTDIANKKLYYNGESAESMTSPEELLACIMHETSHIKHTDPILVDTSTDIYKEAPITTEKGVELLEDIRVDYKILDEYANGSFIIEVLHQQAISFALQKLKQREEYRDTYEELMTKYSPENVISEMLAKRKHSTSLQDQLIQIYTLNDYSDYLGLVARIYDQSLGGVPSDIKYYVDGHRSNGKVHNNYYTGQWWLKQKKEEDSKNDAVDLLLGAYIKYYGGTLTVFNSDFTKKEHNIIDAVVQAIRVKTERATSTREVQEHFEKEIYPLLKQKVDSQKENKQQAMQKLLQAVQNQAVPDSFRDEIVKQTGDNKGFESLPQVKDWAKVNQSLPSSQEKTKQQQSERAESAKGQSNTGKRSSGEPWMRYKEGQKAISKFLSGSSSQLSRILRDNQFDRYDGRHRSGEIKKRGLYKLHTNDTRLFEKKQEKKNKHYAFSLVVDVSGSMTGKDGKDALHATILFSEVLKKLNMPYEIKFFSDRHADGKQFNEKLNHTLFERGLLAVQDGGTRILPPVQDSFKNLLKQGDNKTQRIMIVFTDGDIQPDERNAIKKMQDGRHGKLVQMYGIGLGSDIKSTFRENSFYLKDSSSIMKVFTSILKKHIVRG